MSSSVKVRCIFCGKQNNLTFHHPIDYQPIKIFLIRLFGKPKTEIDFQRRMDNIRRIKHEGGVVPACRKCNDEWELFMKDLLKNYVKIEEME